MLQSALLPSSVATGGFCSAQTQSSQLQILPPRPQGRRTCSPLWCPERLSPPAELCSPFRSVGVLSCQPPVTTSACLHHWGPDSRLYLESLGLGPLGQPSCHALQSQRQEPALHTQPVPLFLPAKMPGLRRGGGGGCTIPAVRPWRALQPGGTSHRCCSYCPFGKPNPPAGTLGYVFWNILTSDTLLVTLTCCARHPSPRASCKLLACLCPALEPPNPAVK